MESTPSPTCRFIIVRGGECVDYSRDMTPTWEILFWIIGVFAFSAVFFIILWLWGKTWVAKIIGGAALCGQDAISDWYLIFYWFSQGDKYWASSMLCSVLFGGLVSFIAHSRTDNCLRGKSSFITLLIDIIGFNFLRTVPLEWSLNLDLIRCQIRYQKVMCKETQTDSASSTTLEENLGPIQMELVRTERRLIKTIIWKLKGAIVESLISFTIVSYTVISSTGLKRSELFKITQIEFFTWISSFIAITYKFFDIKTSIRRLSELDGPFSEAENSTFEWCMTHFYTGWSTLVHTWFVTLYCVAPVFISVYRTNYAIDCKDWCGDIPSLILWWPENILLSYFFSLAIVGIPLAAVIRYHGRDCVRVPCLQLLVIGASLISLSNILLWRHFFFSIVGRELYNFWAFSAFFQIEWLSIMIFGRGATWLALMTYFYVNYSVYHNAFYREDAYRDFTLWHIALVDFKIWLPVCFVAGILPIIPTRWRRYCGCFRVKLGLCGRFSIVGACVKVVNAFQLSGRWEAGEGSQDNFSEHRHEKETSTIDMTEYKNVELIKLDEVVIIEDGPNEKLQEPSHHDFVVVAGQKAITEASVIVANGTKEKL